MRTVAWDTLSLDVEHSHGFSSKYLKFLLYLGKQSWLEM